MSSDKKNTKSIALKILVVEDSPTQAEQLRHLLEEHGFEVTTAADGRQGLEAVRERKPSLLISDIVMPKMGGYELCREIKADARLKDLPVILLTALSSPEDIIKGLQCGADNFIKKPYNEKHLLSRIDYILANRELRKNQRVQLNLEVQLGNEKHVINSERQQILDLLVSTYEEAIHLNEDLNERQKELAHSYQSLQGLYRIAEGLNQCTTEQEVAQRALERALELPNVRAGWIVRQENGSGFRVVSARGLPPALSDPQALEGNCLCRERLKSVPFCHASNIHECQRLLQANGDADGLRYHATVPLRTKDRLLGLMNLVGKEQGLFSDEELTTLDGIGNQVAMALERAELIQNLETKVDEKTNDIQLLEEVAMAANQCSKLDDAMGAVLKLICLRLGWLGGRGYLATNDGTGEFESKGLWQLRDNDKSQKFRLVTNVTRCVPGVGLPGRVLISKKPEWVADITQDPDFSIEEIPQDIVIRACFAVPVLMGQEVAGVLEAFSDRPIDCDQHVLTLMAQVGTQLGRVAEREMGEQAVRRMVYYDPLTGLPNRLFLRDHLKQALASAAEERRTMALLLLDLDRFKDINDTLGHHHGDLLLQEAAKRLKDALPEASVVARLGGDEFAVVLTDARILDAIQCSRKILRVFQKPFVLQGLSLIAKTSIGIALCPDHGQDADLLYQRADVAMYVAKNSHSGYALYDAKKDQYSPSHLVLMSELQEAIVGDQLILFYQPKIDLHTNQVTGVEALVRWQHPKLGLITPDRFLPLAERTGLMAALTNCVIREALIQCHIWAGYGMKIKTSVNLSTDLVQDRDFLAQILPLLKTMGVPAEALMFEITESAIMFDPQRALQNISHMRSLGLSFSIDDFGTGYSSLAYLKNLPVDQLKIDKTFIQNMLSNDKDLAIVRSTIELSHNLGLKVVAEGVETRKIFESLAGLGCDGAQGYYISHPIPGVKIIDWLRDSSWSLDICAL